MKNIAIVIGDSLHNTYGLIRSLGECGIEFYFLCLSNAEYDPIGNSRYVKRKKFFRLTSISEVISILENLKTIPGNKYIICTSDPVATWVDEHEEQLSQYFITPCRGNKIGKLFNKKDQCKLAVECGLDVPKSLVYTKGSTFDYDKLAYPVFIKPLVSSDGSKQDINICRTKEELCQAFRTAHYTSSFIIQEYIENGYDLNCIGIRTNDQTMITCAIRKYRTYPNKYGAGSYIFVDNPERYDVDVKAIELFLEKSGYYGPFSVEFIHTENKNYFMEVNFRNDGLAYSVTCAGLNLYESYVEGKKIEEYEIKPVCLMNVAFDNALRKISGNMSFFKWFKQFVTADGYLDITFKDPMPFLWRPIGFVLRRLKSKSNR